MSEEIKIEALRSFQQWMESRGWVFMAPLDPSFMGEEIHNAWIPYRDGFIAGRKDA